MSEVTYTGYGRLLDRIATALERIADVIEKPWDDTDHFGASFDDFTTSECKHQWVLNFDGVTECRLCGYKIAKPPTSENETDEQPGVSPE